MCLGGKNISVCQEVGGMGRDDTSQVSWAASEGPARKGGLSPLSEGSHKGL